MVIRKVMEDVKIKGKKSEDKKIEKKINKKLQVEAIVQERLSDYDEMKKQEKAGKLAIKKSNALKNLF
jgi:hypothetical protein